MENNLVEVLDSCLLNYSLVWFYLCGGLGWIHYSIIIEIGKTKWKLTVTTWLIYPIRLPKCNSLNEDKKVECEFLVVSSEHYLFTLTFSYFKFSSHFVTSVLKGEPCLTGSLTDHLMPISYSGGRKYWLSWMQYQSICRNNKQNIGCRQRKPRLNLKKKKKNFWFF